MKLIKPVLFFVAIACITLGCKKGAEDSGPDCEENNTTKITYKNTGTVPLRVQVSYQLTPQFVPIDPVISLDLAPGASVEKEIVADKYFTVWTQNCAASCTMVTFYQKTYTQCSENVEERGI